MLHLLGNVDDFIKSDISTVLNVFLLVSVSWWFFEGFDDKGRGRWHFLNLGLTILNSQFHCNPQTLPVAGCFGNVITNLVWRQAHQPNLGGQGRRGTDFPAGALHIYDFDLVRVKLQRHGGSHWCWTNLDSG